MSHVAEVYAKDLGIKIGDPILSDHFYPNLLDNYVYFNPHGDYDSQKYAYWDVVWLLLKEPFERNKINILTAPKIGEVTVKQNNYFIKNSLLYVGSPDHRVQISDCFNIPSVCPLGHIYKSNFDMFKNCEVLTPDFSKVKPSFQAKEKINRINDVKPEDLARKILSQLKIREIFNFKTVRIGSIFNHKTVEIIPNFFQPYQQLKGQPINIRSDLEFNIDNIAQWCNFSIVNLYLDKSLDFSTVSQLPNLKQIIFLYKKEHQKEDLNSFFKFLKNSNRDVIIQVIDKEILSDVRLKYFDYTVVEKPQPNNTIDFPENCKYISNKQFLSKGEVYSSESNAKRLDKSNNFTYDDVSKLELESLYLYVKK